MNWVIKLLRSRSLNVPEDPHTVSFKHLVQELSYLGSPDFDKFKSIPKDALDDLLEQECLTIDTKVDKHLMARGKYSSVALVGLDRMAQLERVKNWNMSRQSAIKEGAV
jgi:hypothetical protein